MNGNDKGAHKRADDLTRDRVSHPNWTGRAPRTSTFAQGWADQQRIMDDLDRASWVDAARIIIVAACIAWALVAVGVFVAWKVFL